MAAQVYQTVGADYVEKIVEPTLRAGDSLRLRLRIRRMRYTQNARELVQQADSG